METTETKFRNHISIVIERFGTIFFGIVIVLAGSALDDLKEEIHCRIEELDAKYPRTNPLHFDAGKDAEPHWHIHVEGKPDNLVCIISVTKVKCLLGEGTVIFPGEEPGNGKP